MSKQSKLVVAINWPIDQFHLLPTFKKFVLPEDRSCKLLSFHWLNGQMMIFTGYAAEFAALRLAGKEQTR